MTVRTMCGFDHGPTGTTDFTGEWNAVFSTGSIATAAARYGANGYSCSANTAGGSYIEFIIGGTEDDVILGAAFYFRNYPAAGTTRSIFAWYEGATKHCDLRINEAGKLHFTRNGTQLGSTGATVLPLNQWVYIECKIHIADSGGSYEVRINEVVENMGTTTSLDTKNGGTGYCDRVRLGNDIQSLTSFFYADDFYCVDDTGAVNTSYLGDIAVRTLVPSGAGNTTNMTPSAGSNYQCVDEVPASTADYVSETTTSDKDTYAMGNLPSAASAVKAVKGLLYAAKQDAGARNLRHVIRSSGTDYEGSSKALSDTFAYSEEIWNTDPATSAAWGASQPDSVEFGPKLQS